MCRTTLLLTGIIALSACGGGSTARPSTSAPVAEPAPEPPPELVRQGEIGRSDLTVVLDAGLGRFLQGVETEPHVDGGRFVGFRVLSFYPEEPRFEGLDLEPGDVIRRVNGQSIERPEQALRVWNGLRVASELLIEYQRGEEERELRFEIVD